MVECGQKVLEKKQLKGYVLAMPEVEISMEILGIAGDERERHKVEAGEEIVSFALEKGGTATGEHGIGIGKKKFMKREHGESLKLMRQIKELLDPKGIMNPGKIFE
jgi:D-lactate dehydrogenase (cytochrome)